MRNETVWDYFKDVYRERKMIYGMSKKEFKARYLGSFLGMAWAFIQPLVMISIFWFVFQVGFKSVPVGNVPFVVWLTAGLVPWFFFSESFSGATHSIVGNGHLVKKMVFKVNILPLVKIQTALYIHVAFLGLCYILLLFYGYYPKLIHLQILYYELALILLVMGLSWLTSALHVFLKDIGEIISMVLQIGFWMTPIFWNASIVPEKYLFILKLNPMYYIVEGFRDTLVYHKWFWESPALTLYFWAFTCIFLFVGAFVFKKLRDHFSDVL